MSFTAGSTPFGTFDADPQFQVDADNLVTYITRKLGAPVLSVELSASHIYASFEEACFEYSAMVNKYQALSVMAALLGSPTGSLSGSENRYPHNLFEFQKRMAEAATIEANLNGPYTLFSGNFVTQVNQQQYDLQAILSQSGQVTDPSKRIEMRELFHLSPLASYRFFGTTSAINYLHNQFSFESFTPETIFYLLPIWEDVLRGAQFKLSNTVRRSIYSYEMHNNVLTLFPPPTDNTPIFFKYFLGPKDPYKSDFQDATLDGVSNISNVPFGFIQYSKLNSISKQWIRRFTFALAKETLGQIRGKFTTVPIPNGDLTLNGPELISDARAEQDGLREELKAILEESTYDKVMARNAQMQEDLNRQMLQVPLLIYIG